MQIYGLGRFVLDTIKKESWGIWLFEAIKVAPTLKNGLSPGFAHEEGVIFLTFNKIQGHCKYAFSATY
jgi:hypothetical protein